MYEIVFSEGFCDAGLCIEKNRDGTPKSVMARASSMYHPDGASYYGGVDLFPWVHSGKYIEKSEWLAKTNQQMSVQDVADAFGINLGKLGSKYHKDKASETAKLRKQCADSMFDTIKNELIEKYTKKLNATRGPKNLMNPFMIDGYVMGVTDTLKVIKYIVEQHQKRR